VARKSGGTPVWSDSGEKLTFNVTRVSARDKKGEGETTDMTFYGHGMYRGAIRNGGHLGPRIELRDWKHPNSATITDADGKKRRNVQIHIGRGASEACQLMQGRAERDRVMKGIKAMLATDKKNGYGDKIFINMEPLPPVGPPAPEVNQ
jgi:hypothetical protein